MTSKLVVNTIEADTGISSVSFASSISLSSTSKFFFSDAGIDIGPDTNINRPAAGVLGFNINGGEKVRIGSDGKVGIGTDAVGSQLNVGRASGNTALTLDCYGVNRSRLIFRNNVVRGTETNIDAIDDDLRFVTNSGERLRIDSSGRVSIGNTAAGSLYASGNNLVVGSGGASNQGITIYTGNAQQGILAFADGTSGGAQQYAGYMIYDHNTNNMLFATQAQVRLGISSEGYVTKPNNAMFKVKRTSNQSVGSNGWHVIQFNTDSATGCFDIGSNFDTSAHKFTAPVTGYYQFGLNQRIDGGDGDYFRVALSVDGDLGASDNYPYGHAIYRDGDGFSYYSFSITALIYLTAGQDVRANAYAHTDTSWTIQDESIFYGYLVG